MNDMLVKFLKFCIKRESDNHINPINTQKTFEKFLMEYKQGNIKDAKYDEIFDAIVNAHEANLNKRDTSAMDYREKDYNSVKTLVLSEQKKGYYLTDDDKITKLNSAAFITTAIVLQGSLVVGLIISLLALVK